MTRKTCNRRPMPQASPVGRAVARAQAGKSLAEFDAYMRKISLKVYLADDGEHNPHLLASLAFALGVGAGVAVHLAPDEPETRRIHAALRTVVQMSVNGGHWNASQAKILHEAAELAKVAFTTYPHAGAEIFEAASYLSNRVLTGTARMSDVAGAELYQKREELTV